MLENPNIIINIMSTGFISRG